MSDSDRMHQALRANLTDLIKQRGLSQRALSRLASLDETAVKQILSGRSRSPRLDTVARLAAALETDVAGLIGERRSDVELFAILGAVFDVFRRFGLMEIDEQEARAVAAAVAEAIALQEGAEAERAEHVASVARNVINLRRYRSDASTAGATQSPAAKLGKVQG
ncbi:MAG: helix-turn-helix transcriptional regulator [Marivibrio sp.]|uniref:helix-turn-helix domain-containing protein n=1 Tax=Marivibrio sp. TaxID=2039719 RepID=UPI0032EE62DA